jgi:hypothetical protein
MTKKEALKIIIKEVEAWTFDKQNDELYTDVFKALEILNKGLY